MGARPARPRGAGDPRLGRRTERGRGGVSGPGVLGPSPTAASLTPRPMSAPRPARAAAPALPGQFG